MAEPITTAEAKAHLRVIDNTSEDTLIDALIAAARRWVEDYSGHILVERDVVVQYTEWGDYLELFVTPVAADAVLEVTYTDIDGAETAFEAFTFPAGQYPLKLYPVDQFPTLGDNGTITVTVPAGYATADEVPEPLIHAIKVMLTAMFKNRGGPWDDAEKAARSLCKAYRAPGMA